MDNKQDKGFFGALIVLSVVLLGVIVGIIVVNVTNNHDKEETVELVADDGVTFEQIKQYISEVDQKIKKAGSSKEKAELYSERAENIASYAEEWDNDELKNKTLSDLYAAEELNPTAMAAYNISYYEELFGDETKANQYYDLAEKRGLSEEVKNASK